MAILVTNDGGLLTFNDVKGPSVHPRTLSVSSAAIMQMARDELFKLGVCADAFIFRRKEKMVEFEYFRLVKMGPDCYTPCYIP